MRGRWGGGLVLVAILSGSAYAGHRVGDGPVTAQATGTSQSGGQGGETMPGQAGDQSGDGSSGQSGGGGGGAPIGGGGSVPSTSAPSGGAGGGGRAPTSIVPPSSAPTSSVPPSSVPPSSAPTIGTPGGGGGGVSSSVDVPSVGGDGGSGWGDSGWDDGHTTTTTGGPPIAPPSTSTSVPREQVTEGRPVPCPPDAGPHVRCFAVDAEGDALGVLVPDGQGGTVVAARPSGPLVNGGFSTSAASNAEVRLHIDVRTGSVVKADPRRAVRQAVLTTIAVLCLVLVFVGVAATVLRRRRGSLP